MNKLILAPTDAFQLAKSKKYDELKSFYISPHFLWGEVFIHCSQEEISRCGLPYFINALIQAETMERVRELWNRPIVVHSWYRDKLHNTLVGGAPNSFHTKGLATDFHVAGWAGIPGNLDVQNKLNNQPFMQLCGLEFTGGDWTHVDSRGYKARFNRSF